MSKTDSKSGIIKALYKKIANRPIDEAQMMVQGWLADIDGAMRRKANAMKVKQFTPKSSDHPDKPSKELSRFIKASKEMFDILEDLTGHEAMEFLWALDNAIDIHKRKKLDKYKISDLKIDLTPKKSQMPTVNVGNTSSSQALLNVPKSKAKNKK